MSMEYTAHPMESWADIDDDDEECQFDVPLEQVILFNKENQAAMEAEKKKQEERPNAWASSKISIGAADEQTQHAHDADGAPADELSYQTQHQQRANAWTSRPSKVFEVAAESPQQAEAFDASTSPQDAPLTQPQTRSKKGAKTTSPSCSPSLEAAETPAKARASAWSVPLAKTPASDSTSPQNNNNADDNEDEEEEDHEEAVATTHQRLPVQRTAPRRSMGNTTRNKDTTPQTAHIKQSTSLRAATTNPWGASSLPMSGPFDADALAQEQQQQEETGQRNETSPPLSYAGHSGSASSTKDGGFSLKASNGLNFAVELFPRETDHGEALVDGEYVPYTLTSFHGKAPAAESPSRERGGSASSSFVQTSLFPAVPTPAEKEDEAAEAAAPAASQTVVAADQAEKKAAAAASKSPVSPSSQPTAKKQRAAAGASNHTAAWMVTSSSSNSTSDNASAASTAKKQPTKLSAEAKAFVPSAGVLAEAARVTEEMHKQEDTQKKDAAASVLRPLDSNQASTAQSSSAAAASSSTSSSQLPAKKKPYRQPSHRELKSINHLQQVLGENDGKMAYNDLLKESKWRVDHQPLVGSMFTFIKCHKPHFHYEQGVVEIQKHPELYL